jgi:phosphoglycolate phosphatase
MRADMNDFPFRIVGFDLDGTLVDTAADLAAAVNHALALIDRAPLSEAEVRPMIGLGAKHMLEQGFARPAVRRTAPWSGSILTCCTITKRIAVHSRPFPGLIATLDQLTPLACAPRGHQQGRGHGPKAAG